jgi:hypothetical protein
MGQNLSKVLSHRVPIDHKGNLTRYSRLIIPKRSHIQNLQGPIVSGGSSLAAVHRDQEGKGEEPADTSEVGVVDELRPIKANHTTTTESDPNGPTLGSVVLASLLGVLAIVSAISLQNLLSACFDLLLPTSGSLKLLALALQFILVFTILLFIGFVFAG